MACLPAHSCCPHCRSREGYHLSDGRRKCCRCGKKYSRRHLKSRLPAKILKQIALYFWLAKPIKTVATDLHLDRKTVRRHYALMQQGISDDESVGSHLSDCSGAVELFSLFVNGDFTWCERISKSARQRRCVAGRNYSWHHSVTISLPMQPMAVRCLIYLVDGLGRYDIENYQLDLLKFERLVRGMCRRKNDLSDQARKLLMSEVVFRFNQRRNPGVTADLYRFLRF